MSCQNPSHDPSIRAKCIVDLPNPNTHLPINWCIDCVFASIKSGTMTVQILSEDKTAQRVYALATSLGLPPPLPKSLEDPCYLARFLDYVDKEIIGNFDFSDFENDSVKQQRFLIKISEKTRTMLHDVEDEHIRQNLTTRLWAGAWDAAKTIREKSASYNLDGTRGPDKVIPPRLNVSSDN
jgi:hypothetical protein